MDEMETIQLTRREVELLMGVLSADDYVDRNGKRIFESEELDEIAALHDKVTIAARESLNLDDYREWTIGYKD